MTEKEAADLRQGSIYHFAYFGGHYTILMAIYRPEARMIRVLRYNTELKVFRYDTYDIKYLVGERYRLGPPPWGEEVEKEFFDNIRELKGDLSNIEGIVESMKQHEENKEKQQ